MSNKENLKELLDSLQSTAGKEFIYDEEAMATAYTKNIRNQSLAIKILSVFGGIMASLTFLGFLFMANLYDSGAALLIIGSLMVACAIWIIKRFDKIIFDTLSVSSFLSGLMLLALGILKFEMTVNTLSIAFILIAILTLWIVQNNILSFVAVLIINGSILTLIISNDGYDLVPIYVSALALILTYVFLKEAKIIRANNVMLTLYNPIRTGLIFSFMSGLIILGIKGLLPVSLEFRWGSSAIIIMAIIYMLSHLLEILKISQIKPKVALYILGVILLLPTASSPAISGAILIILLSFLVNYKTGLAIGIVAFIYFISQYYYDLEFTLLTKSILLFTSGILFIGLYLLTYKKIDIQ